MEGFIEEWDYEKMSYSVGFVETMESVNFWLHSSYLTVYNPHKYSLAV